MSVSAAIDGMVGGQGEGWLSIQQACEYLGISQPTMFRWMKQGIVSFYKVGGSTRFSREGLDAVIEKTTGVKEAEAAAGRCASCGHSVLSEGQIQGIGRMYFRPARTKFWSLEEALVPIQAHVCMACGHVQLHADAAKLRRLAPSREVRGVDTSRAPARPARGKGGDGKA